MLPSAIARRSQALNKAEGKFVAFFNLFLLFLFYTFKQRPKNEFSLNYVFQRRMGAFLCADLSSLFQYTILTPVISLHLIPRIQYHPGIPVTLLTGSSNILFSAHLTTTFGKTAESIGRLRLSKGMAEVCTTGKI